MLVADDGIGLPDDYPGHSHGFRNMRKEAERIGGTLEVIPGEVRLRYCHRVHYPNSVDQEGV